MGIKNKLILNAHDIAYIETLSEAIGAQVAAALAEDRAARTISTNQH